MSEPRGSKLEEAVTRRDGAEELPSRELLFPEQNWKGFEEIRGIKRSSMINFR